MAIVKEVYGFWYTVHKIPFFCILPHACISIPYYSEAADCDIDKGQQKTANLLHFYLFYVKIIKPKRKSEKFMKDLRKIIARNICALRTDMNMTQLRLAQILNYSDKAVSKWERGEAIPDIIVLKQIADYFGVSVDYLLEEDHGDNLHPTRDLVSLKRRNRVIITITSIACVWLVATIIFAIIVSISPDSPAWLAYVFAVPASSIVWLVFNSIWGIRRVNFLIISLLIWSLIISIYLTVFICAQRSLWVLFIVGIPVNFIITFLPGTGLYRYTAKKK